jgi:hypothetical protein
MVGNSNNGNLRLALPMPFAHHVMHDLHNDVLMPDGKGVSGGERCGENDCFMFIFMFIRRFASLL